jgi:hypothetical protein
LLPFYASVNITAPVSDVDIAENALIARQASGSISAKEPIMQPVLTESNGIVPVALSNEIIAKGLNIHTPKLPAVPVVAVTVTDSILSTPVSPACKGTGIKTPASLKPVFPIDMAVDVLPDVPAEFV